MVHLPPNVRDVVVDHGKSAHNGENSYEREGDRRVRHELVGLHSAIARLHLLLSMGKSELTERGAGEDSASSRLYTPGGRESPP